MPNREPAFAWPFGNGPVRVGIQALFRLYLKTFVAPFLSARPTAPGSLRMHSQPLQFQKTDGNGINNIDLQLIDRHQSTSLCRTNQELRLPAYGVSQKNNDIGQAYFFLPSPFSFFCPRTYRKGYYFYSPQSSTVIESKIAATTILRTRTRFRPPKIRLHCRLGQSRNNQTKRAWPYCMSMGAPLLIDCIWRDAYIWWGAHNGMYVFVVVVRTVYGVCVFFSVFNR